MTKESWSRMKTKTLDISWPMAAACTEWGKSGYWNGHISALLPVVRGDKRKETGGGRGAPCSRTSSAQRRGSYLLSAHGAVMYPCSAIVSKSHTLLSPLSAPVPRRRSCCSLVQDAWNRFPLPDGISPKGLHPPPDARPRSGFLRR